MDGDSWIRIILLAILTIGAAYCAASEISYASMNKIRIKNYADNGDRRAIKAMTISDDFDKALTTLLISNNIMHIGFGSLSALIATQLWGPQSVKYTTIITAIFVFLVSEMIPKSYAKANSENFALAVSGSLSTLMKILSPVAFFFMQISNLLSKLFPDHTESTVTAEELYDIIETAQEEGVLDQGKQQLIQSVLKFDVTAAGDILTKRNEIIAVDIKSSNKEILQKIQMQKYSRLPVYKGSMDNIIGILHTRTFLKACITQEKCDLKSLLMQPYYVNKNIPIDDLLRDMSSKKLHMSIVTDESKKVLGVITIEDILEQLVGEIWDENDVAYAAKAVATRSKKDNSLTGRNSAAMVSL